MSQANLSAPGAIFYSCTMTAEKAGIENSITLLVVLQLKYAVFIFSSACEDSYLGLRKWANPWVVVLNLYVK